MTIFTLFAYTLVLSIYAHWIGVVNMYDVPLERCAVFLCVPPCLLGLVMASQRGQLAHSFNQMMRSGRRKALVALDLLGVAIPLVTLYAFRFPAVTGALGSAREPYRDAPTILLTGAVLVASLCGGLASRLFDRPRLDPGLHSGSLPVLPVISVERPSLLAWRPLLTLLAVGGIGVFIYKLHGVDFIDRARWTLSLSWAVLAVIMLQLTRCHFSTTGVSTAGFLFWRYLGPSLLFLALAAPGAAQGSWHLQQLVALGCASAALAWFQYDCLCHYPVGALTRWMLLTPMLVYLLKRGLCMDSPGQVGACAAAATQLNSALLALVLVLCSLLPWQYVQRRSVSGRLAGIYRWFRHDPVTAIGAYVFRSVLLATLLPVSLYLPQVRQIWHGSQETWLWVTMIGTGLFFSVALVCRVLEKLVHLRMVRHLKVAHDIVAPFSLVETMLQNVDGDRLRDPDTFAASMDDLRHRFWLARSLAHGLRDEIKTDGPLPLHAERVDLRGFLGDAREALFACEMRGQGCLTLVPDPDPAAAACAVEIDRNRMLLVLYNLTINSISAWKRAGAADIDGLRLSWAVARAGGRVQLTVRDNGPGIPSYIARAVQRGRLGTLELCQGLGLALSRRAVEAHEGARFEISELRSRRKREGDPRGCAITITLPVASAQPGLLQEAEHGFRSDRDPGGR